MNQRNWTVHLASTICMAKHRHLPCLRLWCGPWFHTDKHWGTEGSKARPVLQRHQALLLPVTWPFDISVCILCVCVFVCGVFFFLFFLFLTVMQHLEEQRLSQTITPCDGSVLLHNEMKPKCLIDFSFTFLTSGGIIALAAALGGPGLRGLVWSHLWRVELVSYSVHMLCEMKSLKSCQSAYCRSMSASVI